MFWDKKEDKRLPDLPSLTLPESPQELPDYPDYSSNSHEDLPDAFPQPHPLPSMLEESELESEHTIKQAMEKEDFPQESVSYIPKSPVQTFSNESSSKSSVFVKLDKFQSAKKSLIVLEQKVNEMENLLKKIRETRLREEQELAAWEKEVSLVKPRIEEISKNLFDKAI